MKYTYNKFFEFKINDLNICLDLKERRTVLKTNNNLNCTLLCDAIRNYSKNSKENILCLNKFDIGKLNMLQELQKMNNGLIVIDDADLIFSDELIEDFVLYDRNNTYLIVSQNFYQTYSQLASPFINDSNISIKYLINLVR